jgi:hypothetical protein
MDNSLTCSRLDFRSLYTTHGIDAIEKRTQEAAMTAGLVFHDKAWVNAEGEQFAIKVQTRSHELFSDLSRSSMLPTLTSSGLLTDGSWWAQLPYIIGEEGAAATPERLYVLGRALRSWHTITPLSGARLDDIDGLSVFLATSRRFRAYSAMLLAPMFAKACEGLQMVPVHADMAVNHNVFWKKDEIRGIIDPYATSIAPNGIDLGFAAAKALARDPHINLSSLFEGYGSVPERWPLMLEAMCSRTYVDCVVDNDLEGQANLAAFSNPAIVKFNTRG